MSKKQHKEISKYLSFILRHKPDAINLVLDKQGWAEINDIIIKTIDMDLSHQLIEEVVKTNDKQRFVLSDDKLKIRANQGHSIDVNLNLTAQEPPSVLYHGTAEHNINSILQEGIKSRKRQYVHLSTNKNTASEVGKRYGKPVVLEVNCSQMNTDGYAFYLSENKVWLTNFVPAKYLLL